MITTNIVFDHKKRGKDTDERPLEARITIDGKSYYVNTGIKVRRSEWKAGVIVNRPNSDKMNTRLNLIYSKIEARLLRVTAKEKSGFLRLCRKRNQRRRFLLPESRFLGIR